MVTLGWNSHQCFAQPSTKKLPFIPLPLTAYNRWELWCLPLPCSTQETGPVAHLSSTVELSGGKRRVTQPLCYEQMRNVFNIHQTCGSVGEGRIPSPVLIWTISTWDRWRSCRWSHKSRRAFPSPHQLQHWEEWPCTLPGQHHRAGPNGIGVELLNLRALKQEMKWMRSRYMS